MILGGGAASYERGTPVNQPCGCGSRFELTPTPTTYSGNAELVQLLLDAKADPNVRNAKGISPLAALAAVFTAAGSTESVEGRALPHARPSKVSF